MNVVLKNGANGEYSIVGSGPNTCVWHYAKKSRKVEDSDLILMDLGYNLAYQTMDITRTWPASGKFTPEQREVYAIVLAVQKASIEAYRPGVTIEDVQNHVAEVMKEKGLDNASDKDIENTVDGEIAHMQRMLDIKKKYHARFKEVLPIKKVAKLYHAEDQFKRRLLSQIGQRRMQGAKGKPMQKRPH